MTTPRPDQAAAKARRIVTQARARLEAGKPALVEIWEDTIPESGFGRGASEAKVWTTVKFLRVERTPRIGMRPKPAAPPAPEEHQPP